MWSDYRSTVRSIVKDDIGPNYLVSDETMLRYANYSIDWVATVHPRLVKETLPVSDGQCSCTHDVHQVEAVLGAERYDKGDFDLNYLEYYVLGNDIVLNGPDTQVTVVYLAGYEHIQNDADDLPVAKRFAEAWMHYLISRCLSSIAVESGDISQWDTKTDSGNPEHNPLLQLARHYEKLAYRGLGVA